MASQRFEMRLDAKLQRAVDAWRADQPDVPSRAVAIRRLVHAGLSGYEDHEIRLSDGEKLTIAMLNGIYRHLEIDDEIDPGFLGNVLGGGHYWALGWEYPGLFHDEIDRSQDVKEVTSILQMWEVIEFQYGKLSTREQEDVKAQAEVADEEVAFGGFDLNDETNHYSIAVFLIRSLKRFRTFKDRDLNTHYPVLDGYRRMLAIFEPMKRNIPRQGLSGSQIVELLKAE